MANRILKGTILSTKMNKTVIVSIEMSKTHPVYGRRFKTFKKLKAHYEGTELKEGDAVTIQEVAPMSKTKNWKIVQEAK